MVSTVDTINQTEGANSIENALGESGWWWEGFERVGTPSTDGQEGVWRVLEGRGGKGRRVRMYYKQFGNSRGGWLVFFPVNKPSPRPLLPPKSGA